MGQAREVVERFYKLFGTGDFPGAAALYSEDCITVTPGGALSNAEHEAFGRAFKNAFPDGYMEVTRAVEDGDEVCMVGRFKGTHTGDLVSPQGTIPASGNSLDMPFADYFRVRAGKIAEQESIFDQMTLLGQVGALPQP
jgi:steroid delta-isomerase-like uncharacterized protein